MPKMLLLVLALLTHIVCCAQPAMNRDSLLKRLPAIKEDTATVNLYLVLANQYLKDNLAESEKYALLAETLSRKIHYTQGISKYYSAYSDVLIRKGKLDAVIAIDLEAIEFAKKTGDSTEVGRTMINAGIAYKQLQDFENAVSYMEKGRDLLIRNGEHKYDGRTCDLLQFLYYSMRQYKRGVVNGLQAVAIFEKSGDTDHLQYACNNLGLNYVMLRRYDSARVHLNKANLLAESTGDVMIRISVNLNFALIALKQQQLDSLKIFATKALSISRQYKANEGMGLAQYGLAYYYLLNNEYASCRLYADSALALAQQNDLKDLKQKIYPVLSSLYFALRDGKKGYGYFSEYEDLSDSISNESIVRNTIQTEKRFQTERQATQIELQQAEIRQKTILNYFLIGGSIALLLVSFLVYRVYRSRQIVQQLKIDELESEKKLTATEAVLKGEEQERTRLAKDLHDGLGGMLSGIKYSLNSMKENLVLTPENAQVFERNLDNLNSSIREMRRVAHNMMPEILLRYGLDTALKEFCNEINRSAVIRATYQSIDMDKTSIEDTPAVVIYRIVQELVNNSIKHANATNILVQVHAVPQEKLLTVTVEDDGKGFDTAVLNNSPGIGWNNVKSRVDFLKGKIDMQSAPGSGTSIIIEINT